MEGAIFIVLLIVPILVSLIVRRGQERKIKEKVESMGGEIVNIEYRKFFAGPFVIINRISSVYRFEYRKDNQIKEGWVKFNLFSSDWILK